MQLNISHEVTTTETKTVDVELPYYSVRGITNSSNSEDYFYCINEEEAVLKVYNQNGYSSFYYVDKNCPSTETYKESLVAAATGRPITRAEFEKQFNTLLSFNI
jgi:hypothetical protein